MVIAKIHKLEMLCFHLKSDIYIVKYQKQKFVQVVS